MLRFFSCTYVKILYGTIIFVQHIFFGSESKIQTYVEFTYLNMKAQIDAQIFFL